MGYKLILQGVVQGVCCRYYCAQTAKRMRLQGSASNKMDGSVEVLIDSKNKDIVKKFAHNLRINAYNYSFYGSITSITIEEYHGLFTGDYEF